MTDRIQPGVFFRPDEAPPAYGGVAFLDFPAEASPADLRRVLAAIVLRVHDLERGQVADLPGQSVPTHALHLLIGYGAKLFARPELAPRRPSALESFRAPSSGGGGQILAGAGLRYAPGVFDNPANTDVVLQFQNESLFPIERAFVEVWKIARDLARDNDPGQFIVKAAYTGHGRDDKRSWIDFFDGTSNLRSRDRLQVIEVKAQSPSSPEAWTFGGTYMAFIRVAVDLAAWRQLSRDAQELLVGRDKLTGCPIGAVDAGGHPVVTGGCPVAGTNNIGDAGNVAFREATRPGLDQTVLLQSHIHRSNQQRQNLADPESRRIFRQGYEFFQGIDANGTPVLGLNFTSFQDTPRRVSAMLTLASWLGGTNFGGDPAQQSADLKSLLVAHAAAFFVVPPVLESEAFPGAHMLVPETT